MAPAETRLLALQIAAMLPSPAEGHRELARLIADAEVIAAYLSAAGEDEPMAQLRLTTVNLARDVGGPGGVFGLVSRARQLLSFLSDPAVPPPVPEGR